MSEEQQPFEPVPRPWPECRDFDAHQLLRLAVMEGATRAVLFERVAGKLERLHAENERLQAALDAYARRSAGNA